MERRWRSAGRLAIRSGERRRAIDIIFWVVEQTRGETAARRPDLDRRSRRADSNNEAASESEPRNRISSGAAAADHPPGLHAGATAYLSESATGLDRALEETCMHLTNTKEPVG
jgi:hypothetical protein